MGMGVDVVGGAVGGPAGVRYAYGAGGILIFEEVLEVIDLALAFVDVDFFVFAYDGHSGAVITAVL